MIYLVVKAFDAIAGHDAYAVDETYYVVFATTDRDAAEAALRKAEAGRTPKEIADNSVSFEILEVPMDKPTSVPVAQVAYYE